MADLHELTALEQAAAIRTREVSAADLVEHYLKRIEEYGDSVGAFVTVTADAARDAARRADDLVARGDDLPPLHGVPIAIKDLTTTAGVRTTFGSAAFESYVPEVDADVVALLRAAGTISLGKTTTSEFGLSLHAETAVAPPARNPWSLAHTAGGSSGGAAAAVAAGLLPFAQGNDGGGSVRIPSAICGLVGFKPSRGLVSHGPIGFGGFGLPTNGPIGRTVTDVAALLDAMAVPVPGEPYPSPPRPAGGFRRTVEGAPLPGGLRIGRFVTPMLADVEVDPVCVAAVDTAAKALTDAGHRVVDVPGLLDPALERRFDTIWSALTLGVVVTPEQEERLLPLTRYLRTRAAELPADRLLADLTAVQHDVRRALRTLAPYDLLLSPVLAAPQAPVGYFAGADPAEDFARQKRFSPYCAAYNITGQPAVSVPVARTADGLPVGAMLAGAVGADALVLAVAAQLEELLPWRGRHPALWGGPTSATVNGV